MEWITKSMGLTILSILIPFLGLFLIVVMDITEFDRLVSEHLVLFLSIILVIMVTIIDYTMLKENKKKLLAFFIVLNFLMSFPVFQTLEYERMSSKPSPKEMARCILPSNLSEIMPSSISPSPEHYDGAYEAHCSSFYIGSYIYTTYELPILTDPKRVRISLTFLKNPKKNAFKDYKKIVSELKTNGYKELKLSLQEMKLKECIFLQRDNEAIFVEVSQSKWESCYMIMILKGEKERLMEIVPKYFTENFCEGI